MREKAKITAINGEMIECTIECTDACAHCAARKVCATGSTDTQNLKTLTLVSTKPGLAIGEMITIEVSTAVGFRAVILAYLVPVALIIGLLLVLQNNGVSDLAAGGIVFGVLALYYISIKLFRLARTISVEIVDDIPTQS